MRSMRLLPFGFLVKITPRTDGSTVMSTITPIIPAASSKPLFEMLASVDLRQKSTRRHGWKTNDRSLLRGGLCWDAFGSSGSLCWIEKLIRRLWDLDEEVDDRKRSEHDVLFSLTDCVGRLEMGLFSSSLGCTFRELFVFACLANPKCLGWYPRVSIVSLAARNLFLVVVLLFTELAMSFHSVYILLKRTSTLRKNW